MGACTAIKSSIESDADHLPCGCGDDRVAVGFSRIDEGLGLKCARARDSSWRIYEVEDDNEFTDELSDETKEIKCSDNKVAIGLNCDGNDCKNSALERASISHDGYQVEFFGGGGCYWSHAVTKGKSATCRDQFFIRGLKYQDDDCGKNSVFCCPAIAI